MAGFWRLSFIMPAFFLFFFLSANAQDGRAPSVYCAPPFIYYRPTTVKVIPLENSCDTIPTPPPPSQTMEPPLHPKAANEPRAPIINTTRSFAGNAAPTPSKERCKVGFWNLTGRDVTLMIDGKAQTLPKNRTVTLDLAHQFVWQIAGGPQQAERVPEGQATHEIVVRE